MNVTDLFRRRSDAEERESIESPSVPISSDRIVQFLGLDKLSSAGEKVTIETALGVPAVWAAVNFLSGSLAGLPLHQYRKQGENKERSAGDIDSLLNHAVSEEMTAFDWRKSVFDDVLTEGRAYTFIDRKKSGGVRRLIPMIPVDVTAKRRKGRLEYEYKEAGNTKIYQASDVIDMAFMLKPDRLTHRGPIMTHTETIGKAQAIAKYAAKFFSNGGVPPFAIEGPFQSPQGMQRATKDLDKAVRDAKDKNRLALALPAGHKIHDLGADPEKSQMVEAERFVVEQVARIYSLPPTFLQDLTNGTFSNVEQEDLRLVKHTLKRWVEQFEQQLNLKLYGWRNNARFVEHNLDGILRGDFKTRMEGYGLAIQNALATPNEIRGRENMPSKDNGDDLMIQGATVPLGTQPQTDDGVTDED